MSTEYSAENQNQYHQTVKQCSTLLESVLLQYPVKITLKVVAVFSTRCSLQIKEMATHKKQTSKDTEGWEWGEGINFNLGFPQKH